MFAAAPWVSSSPAQLTLPFVLGTSVVSVAVYLHYQSKSK